jgi:membrane protease YdiL (CAAX protease family)
VVAEEPDGSVGRAMLRAGLVLEAGLVPLAYGLGWLAGIDPGSSLRWNPVDLAQGLAAMLPLLGLFAMFLSFEGWEPLGRIRRAVEELLGPLMAAARPWELVALCALAGLGEELLFRGFLQEWIARWAGPTAGLLLGGVVFGLAHAITPLYLVLAGAIGVYLGWVWMASGNLLVPIVAHGLYDLVALAWLMRARRRRGNSD